MIEVILLLPHKHKGKQCKVGDKIKINELKIQWLVRRGIINKDSIKKGEK